MRCRVFAMSGIFLGAMALEGCSEGPQIPPSKGGEQSRLDVEYPLGLPKAKKTRKGAAAPQAPVNQGPKP